MNGYIRALLTVPNGYFKLGFIKLFSMKKIYFGRFPRISIRTEISVDNGGQLKIGDRFNMRGSARVRVRKEGNLIIGNNVSFNVNNMIVSHESIEIGNDVQFSPNVQVYDHDHNFRTKGGTKSGKYKSSFVKIGNNVWVGANSIIMRGAIIGDNCVIAAGTVVRAGEYPNGSLIYNERIIKVCTISENEE